MRAFQLLFVIIIFSSCMYIPLLNRLNDKMLIRFGSGFQNEKVDLFINDIPIFIEEEILSDLSIDIDLRYAILVKGDKIINEKIQKPENVLDTIFFDQKINHFILKLDIDEVGEFYEKVSMKNGKFLYLNLTPEGNLFTEYIKKRKVILY